MPHQETSTPAPAAPLILFGACDRHNLGDLLFPHVARALLPTRPVEVAGLAENDLRAVGGDQVHALAQLLARADAAGASLLHVGGELMTCNAWQAAVMLLPPERADAAIARVRASPYAARAWLRALPGGARAAPYCVAPAGFPALSRVAYTGLGGVTLDALTPARRRRVLATLGEADAILVRDARTLAHLHAAGIAADLAPDPVAVIAEAFGDRIDARMRTGPVAGLRADLPDGYIAAQFGGEFADDATLARLARQLDRLVAAGCDIVLFRAGAAPWHDRLECLQRLAGFMRSRPARRFTSLDIWDICALIAASRGYCGSSLHGRIVAGAFALPRVTVRPPADCGDAVKHEAYVATWEPPAMRAVADIDAIAVEMSDALAADAAALRRHATLQARRYRQAFHELTRTLLAP